MLLLLKKLLLLLIHHLLLASAAIAFAELLTGSALLDLLGGLGRDVHGANGLSVGIEGSARVLTFISGSNSINCECDHPTALVILH